MTELTAPSFKDSSSTWAKVGFLSFGGPAAQIALMHRMIVEERKWLDEQQFLNGLNFCMLLPGPEAMQLATYTGWRLHGKIGGLIAGLLFVIPGASIILALAVLYALFGNLPLVESVFLGIKASVLAIVLQALHRISTRTLHLKMHWTVAIFAFIGIFFLTVPYPLIIVLAALFGLLFTGGGRYSNSLANPKMDKKPNVGGTVRTVLLMLLVWWLPLLMICWTGIQPMLFEIGFFFSKLATVTFGGAYAVLAYMAQDVVNEHSWLTTAEMMDGLGLAETTPGPLILVTEFVGFLSVFKEGGFALGLAGALLTLWVTFVPCFLWVFAGAPYIEWLSAQPRLKGALTAITAAVVGVMLNLSIWFALHVFFREVKAGSYGILTVWEPIISSFDWRPFALFLLCSFLVFKVRMGILKVLTISSLLGLLLAYLGGHLA